MALEPELLQQSWFDAELQRPECDRAASMRESIGDVHHGC
jgi:hypothetical protein